MEFNRVNGNLALSRAIGDFNFKSNQRLKPEEQIITGMLMLARSLLFSPPSLTRSLSLSPPSSPLSPSIIHSLTHSHAHTTNSPTHYSTLADPEIITSEIHAKDEFVVLACDGKCLAFVTHLLQQ